jgi:MYXO-CTERM domain-containing protein
MAYAGTLKRAGNANSTGDTLIDTASFLDHEDHQNLATHSWTNPFTDFFGGHVNRLVSQDDLENATTGSYGGPDEDTSQFVFVNPNYSLTQILKIVLNPQQRISFQITTSVEESDAPGDVVPEPASMAIWGLGGIGLAIGAALRRRRRKAA